MARGLPGVWSTLLSIPFFASSAYVFLVSTPLPEAAALPLFLFGAFIFVIGWYIHLVAAPSEPTLQDDEEIIETRYPTQKSAVTKVIISLPFLGLASYLLVFTRIPYVYPTGAYLVGLYLLSTGILAYWTNTLTIYYITNHRVISEFRFLSLARTEIPLEKVRAVRESRSPIESLVGIGNIRVSSGGGQGLEVTIRHVDNVQQFADELRQVI